MQAIALDVLHLRAHASLMPARPSAGALGKDNLGWSNWCLSFQSLDEALKYCNYVFTIVFVFEAVLKLVAFGFRRFFKDR